jgi:hypothetical protein
MRRPSWLIDSGIVVTFLQEGVILILVAGCALTPGI